MSAEERWASLVETMLAQGTANYGSDAGPQRAFGSTSLKTNGKIFAMLVNERLVVKLDRRRVDTLVAASKGERFDPGHGRLMKEWLAVDAVSDEEWRALATEAEAFVARRRA
jgi:TfoX/Sxy family transcriptional regulator of competence genes